jgi:UDP-N-acetylmuramoylalanine--D-glutamate ligase
MITKLNRGAIQDLTDRLLSSRQSNLKMVLDIDHRLETLGEKYGVEYINDSKSTTLNATAYSLKCMNQPVVWLLSCMNHQQDLSALHQAVEAGVKSILYLGNEDESFVSELVHHVDLIQRCDSMEELVKEAASIADVGDVILFSPACPVSDSYTGFAERGDCFKSAFYSL